MSEQWHYEQKGESYIKVDTLHKIRTLETELAAARKGIAKLKEQYTPWWARERSEIDKLREVTEQRDEYKAALQSADNHNHEIGTKLEIVTEQRDRLAEAIRKHKFCGVELYEALQSLNQNANCPSTGETGNDHE